MKNIFIINIFVILMISVGVFFLQLQDRLNNAKYTYVKTYEVFALIIDEKVEEDEVSEEQEYENDYYESIQEFIPIFSGEPLPDDIIEYINGLSFKEDTALTYGELTYLTITYVNFDGENMIGNMIVSAEIGEEVLDIFQEIYESGFPINSIRLIDDFNADDDLSMAANNSSAFNWRYVAGTRRLSNHAFGMAIDINPVQNPYVRGGNILPAAGEEYLDRSDIRPGMIIPGDVVYNAFISRGWTWGGNWTTVKDYHHFERT